MKRNKIIGTCDQDKLLEHKQRVAFHEAGHAAAIYLNNKARNLPPVFFKIIFKDMDSMSSIEGMAYQSVQDECIARVEGGRLIEILPPSIDSLMRVLTERNGGIGHWVTDYMTAFDADIINLLIGPLAEAKHVAETDDEPFNHKLVNLEALKNYGGSSDLVLVNEYLQFFSANKQQKDEKLAELFAVAFNFINNPAHWSAVAKLAGHVLNSNKNITCSEEIASILDQSLDHFQHR
ncbi:MAG: hypothetical protein ACXWT1_08460 [Methylobacter sp.]